MSHHRSDGIESMPRRLTAHERLADQVFRHLQFTMRLAPFLGAGTGYAYAGFMSAVVGLIVGGFFSLWIWYSMGARTPDPDSYYRRMEQRANGSRRRLLEWVLEKLRRNEFTRTKCQALSEAHHEFHRKAATAGTRAELMKHIEEFDRVTKEISYGSRR